MVTIDQLIEQITPSIGKTKVLSSINHEPAFYEQALLFFMLFMA